MRLKKCSKVTNNFMRITHFEFRFWFRLFPAHGNRTPYHSPRKRHRDPAADPRTYTPRHAAANHSTHSKGPTRTPRKRPGRTQTRTTERKTEPSPLPPTRNALTPTLRLQEQLLNSNTGSIRLYNTYKVITSIDESQYITTSYCCIMAYMPKPEWITGCGILVTSVEHRSMRS